MSESVWSLLDAAQPTLSSGGAAQPTISHVPDSAPVLTVGFYNVGIQKAEVEGKQWKTKERELK